MMRSANPYMSPQTGYHREVSAEDSWTNRSRLVAAVLVSGSHSADRVLERLVRRGLHPLRHGLSLHHPALDRKSAAAGRGHYPTHVDRDDLEQPGHLDQALARSEQVGLVVLHQLHPAAGHHLGLGRNGLSPRHQRRERLRPGLGLRGWSLSQTPRACSVYSPGDATGGLCDGRVHGLGDRRSTIDRPRLGGFVAAARFPYAAADSDVLLDPVLFQHRWAPNRPADGDRRRPGRLVRIPAISIC